MITTPNLLQACDIYKKRWIPSVRCSFLDCTVDVVFNNGQSVLAVFPRAHFSHFLCFLASHSVFACAFNRSLLFIFALPVYTSQLCADHARRQGLTLQLPRNLSPIPLLSPPCPQLDRLRTAAAKVLAAELGIQHIVVRDIWTRRCVTRGVRVGAAGYACD